MQAPALIMRMVITFTLHCNTGNGKTKKYPEKKHQRAPKKVPKSFNYMGSRSVGHQSTQKVLKYINFTLQLHTGTGKTKKYPEEGPKSTLKSTKEHLKKYQKALILRVASWSVIKVPYKASKYVTFTLQLHPGKGKSTLQPQHLLEKKLSDEDKDHKKKLSEEDEDSNGRLLLIRIWDGGVRLYNLNCVL